MPRNHIQERLVRGEIVLLDGAMGTELERRGVATPLPLWSAHALLDAPDAVRGIHREYVEAGADVITAATFRATPRTLAKAGLPGESDRLITLALALAREARESAGAGRDVWVAGSLAPLEDCYRPDLAPPADVAGLEHAEQAARLARAGCDLILVETMNTIAEASAAVRGAKATGLPVLVSFICESADTLLGGEALADAARAMEALRPDGILVNCVPADIATGCLDVLARATPITRGCFPNAGGPDLARGTWNFDPAAGPEWFAGRAREWLGRGAQIVGGCCGTGPEHIRALRSALPPVLLE
jgi:S-methylmethionine-dependent homocysteine/selenocysteine methylase